jgi:antitoxin CptB
MIHELTDADLDEFEHLMQAPDPEVYRWVAGETSPPAAYDRPLFRRLCAFHRGERA